jgi:hypothetical protein
MRLHIQDFPKKKGPETGPFGTTCCDESNRYAESDRAYGVIVSDTGRPTRGVTGSLDCTQTMPL